MALKIHLKKLFINHRYSKNITERAANSTDAVWCPHSLCCTSVPFSFWHSTVYKRCLHQEPSSIHIQMSKITLCLPPHCLVFWTVLKDCSFILDKARAMKGSDVLREPPHQMATTLLRPTKTLSCYPGVFSENSVAISTWECEHWGVTLKCYYKGLFRKMNTRWIALTLQQICNENLK